jgi:hypothetical protein
MHLLFYFKHQVLHFLWSNYLIHIYIIYNILDKTHIEHRFLPVPEEADMPILPAEDPVCVLVDGTKQFGVTIGNLPTMRF